VRPLAHIWLALRRQIGDHRFWISRAIVLAFAALSGITVVGFVWCTDLALAHFFELRRTLAWLPLIWTPACTAAIVWFTRTYAPGAAGSGIPQVIAALDPGLSVDQRKVFVSIRLSVAKVLLTSWGLLAGLSIGREGPSVQVSAGIMRAARRWLPARSRMSEHGLLVAGGAAGIAAAFNAPLAGVMFAIEELSRNPEQRSSGLIISAIVLAGLIGVSVYGDHAYFGVIQARRFGIELFLPGLVLAVAAGMAGGAFAGLILRTAGRGASGLPGRWRGAHPVVFAAACGFAVAVLGLLSDGATFGSGYAHTRAMLSTGEAEPLQYAALKFMATWLTAWSGVPAGIFAPALAIGAALGNDVAVLAGLGHQPALIALGMAGFLAAATQAPLTAFIIVMEMVDGHSLVLSLMACALVANAVSRIITRPLYASLAQQQLARLRAPVPARLAEGG
jgi:H+/Cl- antiporter ClcA